MKKLILSVILLTLVCGGSAEAQITPTYTFTPGTTILSSQVNANFTLLQNALNRTGGTMTGTLNTQNVLPVGDNAYDLGSASFKYRNTWIAGTATLSGTLAVTGTATFRNISAETDATYDIGASGTKFRDAFFSRDITVGRNYKGPAEFDAGNSGAAITVTFTTNGPTQKVTRNNNTTVTLAAPGAGYYTIRFVHDATANSYTVAFSPSVKFPAGTAPTWSQTNGAIDILTLYFDGTTWYGAGQVTFS